jgi:hypothetical protein
MTPLAGEIAASAQTNDSSDSKASSDQEAAAKKKRQPRGSFVVAPLPISSPALGSGIVPVVAYILSLPSQDQTSEPSGRCYFTLGPHVFSAPVYFF